MDEPLTPRNPRPSGISLSYDVDGVDWIRLKRDLNDDDFDNGRSPEQLERSCRNSFATVFARAGDEVIGMARLLSDGVCNAYLVDVWTLTRYRRRGIGSEMVRSLLGLVPGQHVILQTDNEASFYRRLGFQTREGAMQIVVGEWLKG